jgi:nucleoside-diphosphate kinase
MMTIWGLFSVLLALSLFYEPCTCGIIQASSFLTLAAPNDLPVPTASMYSTSEERTFVAIKPDAVQRNLIGEIIKRVEQKGLTVVALKLIRPSVELVSEHYGEHKEQYFFQDLVSFFLSGPIVAMVLEGCNAIEIVRKLIGKTQPEDAEAGTIRGDYCFGKGRNLVHASDSIENAAREIGLWFSEGEIVSYSKTIDQWVKFQPPPVV